MADGKNNWQEERLEYVGLFLVFLESVFNKWQRQARVLRLSVVSLPTKLLKVLYNSCNMLFDLSISVGFFIFVFCNNLALKILIFNVQLNTFLSAFFF